MQRQCSLALYCTQESLVSREGAVVVLSQRDLQAFFLERNPNFLDGEIFLACMPLDFVSMTQSLGTAAKRTLGCLSGKR